MKRTSPSFWFRGILTLSILFVLMLGGFTNVQAAGSDDDGTIGPDEVIYDDVFLNGDNVVMDGTVNGALFAAGNTVTINGTVNGDAILMGSNIIISESALINGNLLVGGQSIQLNGEVTGSVAAGSSTLIMSSGSVARNVYYGGFSLEMEPEARVGIDVFSGVYQAMLKGIIGRDANIAAGAVEIDGSIARNANINMGQANSEETPGEGYMPFTPMGITRVIEPGLRVSESASIGGKLTYTYSLNQGENISSQPAGGIVFQTPIPEENKEPGVSFKEPEGRQFSPLSIIFGRFMSIPARFWRDLSSLLILGAMAIWLLPSLLKKSVAQLRAQPLPAAGYGLLATIGGYIAAFLAGVVILLVSFIVTLFTLGALKTATFGLGFALLTLAFTVFILLVFFGSRLVVAYLVGEWLMNKLAPNSPASQQPFWGLALGVFIFALLHAIPLVGWLFGLVATVFGMGAFVLLFLQWRKPSSLAGQAVEIPQQVQPVDLPGTTPQ
jgi:cytoskeletal protein CcmA (bactofilin family)